MWFLSVLSAASDYLTNPGSCLVACIGLLLAAYLARHIVDNAAYLKFKSNNFEGEYRPRNSRRRPKMR